VNESVPIGTHLKKSAYFLKSFSLVSLSYVPPFLHLSGTKLQTVLPTHTYKITNHFSKNNSIINFVSVVDK
jgi:hypothetical protein